jgi:hypothetical protein
VVLEADLETTGVIVTKDSHIGKSSAQIINKRHSRLKIMNKATAQPLADGVRAVKSGKFRRNLSG